MAVEEIQLDIRGLEPPEPYERATSALRSLPAGHYMKIVSPRRPLLLYPWLEKFGFSEATQKLSDENFHVIVWHRNDLETAAALGDRFSWFPGAKD